MTSTIAAPAIGTVADRVTPRLPLVHPPDARRQPDGARPGAGSGSGTRARLDHIDAMRPIKQAGVISTHSLLAFAPAASVAAGASIMLLHVTREAFLFVSACMLAYGYRGLGRGGLGTFYRRRFVAVGIPYLCWTLIYFLVTLQLASGWSAALGHFGYLLASGYYQLYYLLVIMQFYLVFPLLMRVVSRWQDRPWTVLAISAALQLAMVSMMHWGVLPGVFGGFWATREITSYQFYLVAGLVVALHLHQVHLWLVAHVRAVITFTLASAVVAEGWYWLAAVHHVGWLGSSDDAFQPVVMPFNIGAIACIYLAGTALVDRHRSQRVRDVTRSGSDNSYGVYLAQMIFILTLGWLGWGRLTGVVPWPIVCVATVIAVFGACVLLTSILARTPLARALTGRSRVTWDSWLPSRAPRPVQHDGTELSPSEAAPGGWPGR
jgi:peptidoglycan/LPS O-acetylase OafA/YrhL